MIALTPVRLRWLAAALARTFVRTAAPAICAVMPLLCATRAPAQTLTTQVIANGLPGAIMVKGAPGDTERLFIVMRSGRVVVHRNGGVLPADFLNITSQVSTIDERGMLDIAFHPNYAANGYFYVRFNDTSGHTVVRRYTRSANPDVADAGSGYDIIRLTSTISFHIGGSIEFGPEGYLYVTVGDATFFENAQDITHRYGKILRIDVNSDAFPGDPDKNYAIPPGNPFAGPIFGADEIWAYGVRNPFRISFDRATGAMWIGDVQGVGPEEIDYQPPNAGGRNYGWPCREASTCWPNQRSCDCDDPTLIPPVFEYSHDGGNCAVTGGRVYRGCAIPALSGTYFCADFCSGRIISFRYVNGQIIDYMPDRSAELDPPGPATIGLIVGFGEDTRGELYICDLGGEVFKIIPVTAPPDTNGNGIPDTCEGQPGDVDDNGVVNVSDLLAVILAWGPCAPPPASCPADVAPHPNGDGTVNVSDLIMVILNWG